MRLSLYYLTRKLGRLVSSFCLFFKLVTGAAFLALGAVLAPLVNLLYQIAIWLSAALLVALSLVGFKGSAWINIVHLIVIIVAFAIGAIKSVNAVGA